ncbi:MAG: methionine--tRNA ligase [Methanosarcinales archaeon]
MPLVSDFPVEKPVLVTCGLPYANGRCHIGHLRTYVPADIFVRTLRKQGQEVVFVCGSDTHGTPIVMNAEELGILPGELVEMYHAHFDEIFRRMGVEFDYFGTTDAPSNHHRTLQIVESLIEAGHVYSRRIELAYCPRCDRFLPDRYVEGLCPYCGVRARGDECDQGCGKHLEPGEIREPLCKVCGREAEYRTQEHFFFRLSRFKDFLLQYLPGLRGTSNARNYAIEWVNQELRDWCITRNMEWGVSFPGHEGLVVYVWVDAPIGYISFTEEWAKLTGGDWEAIWRGDSRIIHFIGLDIVYHHCIFWPAILKGAGYTVPWAVVASGMVKIEDKKFSKSRGYIVWVDEDYLAHGFHPDLLRYYLASYTSHTKELNFSWKIFQEKVNKELVGSLGNFLYRTTLFAYKNFKQVPMAAVSSEVMDRIGQAIDEFTESIGGYEFKRAVDSAMALSDFGNTYFQSTEPWKLVKTNREACAGVIKDCLQIAKALIVLFEPVMPGLMEVAWRDLGLRESVHTVSYDEALVELEGGRPILKPEILFNKIDDGKIEEMERILSKRIIEAVEKEMKNEKDGEETRRSDSITLDEFERLDLRIGTVKEATSIKGSEKLLKLTVDLGETIPRVIVAGIREHYTPEELLERQVLVVANMEPAKLFGVESQGMLLATENGILLKPDEPVKNGVKVR